MPVRKAGNFWLTIHDNHRSRQYRRKVIKITDDPLTDREETIGLLCAEVEQLQAENEFLKLNAKRTCTCGFPLEDKVDLLDRIVELKEELAKARPLLDAAMEYAKTPRGVSREALRAKSLAADRMFKAARAMEE